MHVSRYSRRVAPKPLDHSILSHSATHRRDDADGQEKLENVVHLKMNDDLEWYAAKID